MLKIQSELDTVYRVKELINNLRYLDSVKHGSNIEIGKIEYVTPLSITPVSAIINNRALKYNYQGDNDLYLKILSYPERYENFDNLCSPKTFFPITRLNFKNMPKTKINFHLMNLHSKFLELLKIKVINDQRFIELIGDNTFGFLFGEMFDNIEQHSNADNVYLFAQHFPQHYYCEICFVDDGQGLYGSLKNANRGVKDSQDALKKILESGLSAKTEYGELIRGTGINNTRIVLTNNEIKGEYFILSGNAAFLQSANSEPKFFTSRDFYWNGTIVMLKLYKPNSTFNLYNYVK